MSARFLHVFTDENPELQKQIGCMTGIFQMFDRQYVLKGRRISHSQKRHSSGHGLSTSASLGAEHDASSPRIVLEKRLSKSVNENQRISMESSSTSFSSTSYSSFSSLEYSKSCQQEPLLFDRTVFLDKPSKRSPELKTSNADGQPPCHDPRIELPNSSVHTVSCSLDFRDAVKESIKRNSHGLSVNTSPEQELKNHALKHRDSPRPLQVSRSTDGSYVVGINGKSREPVDANESIRVLVKLKEAPGDFSEFGVSPRMLFEGKAGSFYPEQRDAHRFSYDGRERSLQSLESRENDKLPREPPRLSLDSRQGSQRNSKFDSRPTSIFNDLDGSNSYQRVTAASNLELGSVSHKRSTSVVAKLMGLEAMPSLRVVTQDTVYSSNNCDPSKGQRPKSLNASQESREDFLSSPKRYIKNSVNPGIKDRDSKMKPISNAKVLIQPTPWGQQEKQSVPQKVSFTHQEAPAKQRHESVYSEIEKRLKELEFRQSSKDLRTLQQIVDTMQEKGLLETKKGDQETIKDDQSLISAGMKNQKTMPSLPAVTRGTAESPIVIMKPANSVKRSRLPPSVIHLEGLSGVQKLQTRSTMDRRKAFTNHRLAKGKNSNARNEDNVSHKVHSETVQVSSKPQQSPREDGGSSLKISGSLSPKLRQKRLEVERSQPPLPSSDSSNRRGLFVNSKPAESVSPRSKFTQKPAQVKDSDERLSKSSETRNFSCQGDEISQRSDTNLSLSSQLDFEGTIADRSADNSVSQQSSRSPSGKAARKAASVKKLKKPSVSSSKEVSRVEFVTAAPEQPSPISALDTLFYQDDWPRSPSKKNLNSPKDEKYLTSDDPWTPSTLHDIRTTSSSTEFDQKKLLSIENLVQKLSVPSSSDDWPSPRDHIASICETQNPDCNYVSEMGTTPVQLHPINPDSFLILEQMKTGWLPSSGTLNSNTLQPKTDQEILHTKLVSDIVNEVLIQKLELTSSDPRPDHFIRSRKLTCRFPNGQQLLNELCLEIEKLQADIPRGENCGVEIKMSKEEVLCRSDGWADFDKEVPGLVLEMERLVFKDLIDEIVIGEAVPVAQSKASRRRRQLFGK